MRIGLDARALNGRFVRGMGEYLNSLISETSLRHDARWYCYGPRPDLPFHRPADGTIARVALTDIPGNRFHVWEQMYLPFSAWRDRVDVLHCASTTLPLWQPVPTVVTIHDTIQWNTGEDLVPGLYRDRLLPAAFARCQAIITISHHSRRDILRHWPRLEDRIHVIHHGVGPAYLDGAAGPVPDIARAAGIDRPYVMYVGGDAPRKRLDWTIELFSALGRDDIALMVVGLAETAHAAFRAALPEPLRGRVHALPFAPEAAMPALYGNALAVIYPTLYEGFGFPALKAQAMGTPILLSAVSSLLELVGPTSIALPPDDRAAWLDSLAAVVDRRLAQPAADEASRAWARQFDLGRTAEAHWRVYEQASGQQAAGRS